MNILYYIFFITNLHNIKSYFIQNKNQKICADCKFFIAGKDKCRIFGNVNIITGKYNYEAANLVRNDKNKCGNEAIFFKKNYFKFITTTCYHIKDEWILVSLIAVNVIILTAYAIFFITLGNFR